MIVRLTDTKTGKVETIETSLEVLDPGLINAGTRTMEIVPDRLSALEARVAELEALIRQR